MVQVISYLSKFFVPERTIIRIKSRLKKNTLTLGKEQKAREFR